MTDELWGLLSGDAVTVAPRLLGALLVRELNGRRFAGKIVEAEAYDQADAASHSYRGRTARTEVMFGPAGHLYVYFTYGMHYCCNVVTGSVGHGSAVLIRAVEPVEGIELIREMRRSGVSDANLTNGPGKLCQAFGIDKALNGHDLREVPLRLILQPPIPASQIIQTTRIGITQARDRLWRFYLKGNRFVSHT